MAEQKKYKLVVVTTHLKKYYRVKWDHHFLKNGDETYKNISNHHLGVS